MSHGHFSNGRMSPTYQSWRAMKHRCLNPKASDWPHYGGRGIQVCERWMMFENFLADMGERPEGMTIDRENNDGGYEPRNCRWATRQTQTRNSRANLKVTLGSQTRCLADWCDLLGVQLVTFYARVYRQGMTYRQALLTPVRNYRKDDV